jgi:hypothetical protein
MDVRLTDLAQAYVDHGAAGPNIRSAAAATLRWDENYCRRVADYFEQAPLFDLDAALSRGYEEFKRENVQHYRLAGEAGITVRPWLAPGQPYRGSAEMHAAVRSTGTLHVYLTSAGHGPGPGRGDHPMLEPSGIAVDGVEFCHNDVFRAVHDVFGHLMSGTGFSPRGELRASFCHMAMYPEAAHPVLFTEQVAQICWYFFGPHAGSGRYPEQKVFAFPQRYLAGFRDLFAETPARLVQQMW